MLVVTLPSCASLDTKLGGSYEQRQRGDDLEKMWGCKYSGTKLDYSYIKASGSQLPNRYAFVALTFVSIDIIFSLLVDTVFLPADYIIRKSRDKNFDALCSSRSLEKKATENQETKGQTP